MLGVHLGGRGLLVDRAHGRRHQRLRTLRHAREQVPHEVGAAALPGGAAEDGGDSLPETLVGVGGHQLHAGEPARHEAAQKRQPEGPVLAGTDVDAQHLALPLHVDRSGNHHAHLGDAALLAYALGERVEPEVAVGAGVEGPAEEARDDRVELRADTRDLALRDALAAERAHEVVDAACGDPWDGKT